MEVNDIPNELITKASNGDLPAFEEIYKAAAGFVYNVSLGVCGNVEDAQEVTQEVFVKLFRDLKSFKFNSSFKTWLYRVSVNAALNSRKKYSTDNNRRVEFDDNIDSNSKLHENPVEKSAQNSGNEETVKKLLSLLSFEHRTCIVLREMQGLSYEEIAQSLKININTVRSRLKRAREILLSKAVSDEMQ